MTSYEPCTAVEYEDGFKWLCLCTSGPELNYDEPGNEVVLCSGCGLNWGHVRCYGLTELAKNKEQFERYHHLCLQCANQELSGNKKSTCNIIDIGSPRENVHFEQHPDSVIPISFSENNTPRSISTDETNTETSSVVISINPTNRNTTKSIISILSKFRELREVMKEQSECIQMLNEENTALRAWKQKYELSFTVYVLVLYHHSM